MNGSPILELLKTGSVRTLKQAIGITCLAGFSNIVLISLINIAAEQTAMSAPVGAKVRILYVIGFAIFFLSIRSSLDIANRFLQQRLGALRLRIVNKIRLSELRTLETLGRGQIFATLAKEGDQLSQNFPMLVSAVQSVVSLAFCLFYIAYLSLPAFLVIGSTTIVGLFIFWFRRRALNIALLDVHHHEDAMFESLGHFTDGFQEIRLNAAKNDALYQRFLQISDKLESVVVNVGGRWVSLLMFSNAFLYVLLGIVVFVLPFFFQGYTDIIYKIAATAIFCVGPFTSIIITFPIFSRANAELDRIFKLEQKLETGTPIVPNDAYPAISAFKDFECIKLNQVCFTYVNAIGESTFSSGPFDMEIKRGEIVFMRGGNGSGKSTLMRLFCGLYVPDEGTIEVDGVKVSDRNRQQYREIFTCIFTDFHLFDRLYGLNDIDPDRARELIEWMELTGKVELQNNRFSTLKLSQGQRKRLAMIVSLLEDNQVFVFDEWAADQDAHFREIFYSEILPDLKRRNKTIVAVTHDEQYWHLCDKLSTLDLGKLTLEPGRPNPVQSS